MSMSLSSQNTASVHPDCLYALLTRNAPLVTKAGASFPRGIPLPTLSWKKGIPMGVDNGNYRIKITLLDALSNSLVNQAIIAATGPDPKTRTKVSRTKYRVRCLDTQPSTFSGWFLIGCQAINLCPPDQLSLGVGSTGERLGDVRQLDFVLASLVESLKLAHYPAGTYPLICGFGVPNDEFVSGDLCEETTDALGLLMDHSFEVERQEQDQEKAEKYVLTGAEVIPTPQTSGTFAALNYGIDGKLCESNVVDEIYVDFGGGHTQEYRVSRILNERSEIELVGTGGRLGVGRGSIAIARVVLDALRDKYPNLPLSDIYSQVVLADNQVRVHGVSRPLDEIIDHSLLENAAETLLTDVLKILQQESSRVTFTGGGLSLDLIAEPLKKRAERRGAGLLLLDTTWASILNSYGIYQQAVMDSSKRNLQS